MMIAYEFAYDIAVLSTEDFPRQGEGEEEEGAGGLEVWLKEPAASGADAGGTAWDFEKWNAGSAEGKAWLSEFVRGAPRVSVPYRCNRMVVFKSSLLHKTEKARFREGYLSRRVNFTFLFGRIGGQ